MTPEEATELANSVDLTGYRAFVGTLTPSAYWRSPYEAPQPEGRHFIGEVWWSIYSYMALGGYIDGNPNSYNNRNEHLYDEVLKRLVTNRVYTPEEGGWRWFTYTQETHMPQDPEYCPDCDERAVRRTRGIPSIMSCSKGHTWHACPKHRTIVRGVPARGGIGTCTCNNAPERLQAPISKLEMLMEDEDGA